MDSIVNELTQLFSAYWTEVNESTTDNNLKFIRTEYLPLDVAVEVKINPDKTINYFITGSDLSFLKELVTFIESGDN